MIRHRFTTQLLFALGLAFSLSPWASPPLALAAGIVFALIAVHPAPSVTQKKTKWLLQASVVLLGFGMNLKQIVVAGRSGFVYTAVGITFALAIGMMIGRFLSVSTVPAFLISTGTAICGGSAIAAVAPITGATDDDMSVSLGTIFVLNSVALLIFPSIGGALGLTQKQFGLWAALAIHDTSSVVGAAAKYGATALAIATTVKLARALWIIPLTAGTAAVKGAKTQIQWPWFVVLFVGAAALATALPGTSVVWNELSRWGKIGLTLTLFLIGTSLSPGKIARVGPRPLLQGIILWAIVASVSLAAIRAGWMR